MSQLVAIQGAMPAVLAAQGVMKNDLAAGVQGAFAILTIRGKVFRIKYRGEETALMRADGTGPMQAVNVVIVKASPTISKIFYPGGYTEGSSDAPACWSVNGQTPDPASPQKQCETCAACPMNIWGSKITEQGKKGKMCADSKRLVIVPEQDMKNEAFGGPMLIRVPAASLGDMAQYGSMLEAQGAAYFGVVTQLSFGIDEAYPKLAFKPIRYLSEAEAQTLLALQNDPTTHRILSEAVDFAKAEPGVTGAPGVPQIAGTPPAALAGAGIGAGPLAPPAAAVSAQPVAAPAPAPTPVAQAPVKPNPFGAAPAPQPVAAVAAAMTPPVATQPAAVVQTVAAPAPAPAPAPAAPPVEETMEQKLARLMAENEALKNKKAATRRTRVAAPSPIEANTTVIEGTATVVQPVTPQGDALAPVAGAGADVLAALESELEGLV